VVQMKINLGPNTAFMKDGKLALEEDLLDAGVKAGVCYNDGLNVTPETIRNTESKSTLIARGIRTILETHTSPTEQQNIGLEITGISKRLCMILNNQKEYTADERSFRYTEVKVSDAISQKEVLLYNKWLKIFEDLITAKYWDFYRKFTKTDKGAKNTIHKLAQENARYMLSIDTTTTLTYTVPLAQINKIALYMKRVIENPMNQFERDCVPQFQEFIKQLKDLNVIITKEKIYELSKKVEGLEEALRKSKLSLDFDSYKGNDDYLYINNKEIDLSLFSWRNKFSVIDYPNMVNPASISYNNYQSYTITAHEVRHRTFAVEIKLLDEFKAVDLDILHDTPNLLKEWFDDMYSVRDCNPQGQLIKVNRIATIYNLIHYVGKERLCERAQLEIEKFYLKELLPYVKEELLRQNNTEFVKLLEPYIGTLRCMWPDFKCPSPCHHPRLERKI